MKKHNTQHRPEREQKEPTKKQFAQLRSENHKLKREISRLNRQIEKMVGLIPEEEMESEQPEPQTPEEYKNKCPECEEKLTGFSLGVRDIMVCKGCGWRKVIA